jgi:Permuted papain-like amidase enzyme, YaeF/YiiX, C92 family
MRAALLAIVLMGIGVPAQAASPSLSKLDAGKRAERQEADLKSEAIYRAGVARLVSYAQGRSDLFPAVPASERRIVGPSDRETVAGLWKSLLDYYLALDSLGRYHADYYRLTGNLLAKGGGFAPSFHLARGAFLTQYRYGLEFIQLAEKNPKIPTLLNDPVPELGLAAGSYDQFKFRYLNVAAASQFAAYNALARAVAAPQDPELARAIAEDEALIWKAGRGKGEALTVANAGNVIRKLGGQLSFPVFIGVSEWMGDTKVLRQDQTLISQAQITALRPRLKPGDVLLERREWYMSNVGLPGFWSHAALYLGTPEERRVFFDDQQVHRWVKENGEASGDFERLLKRKYPNVYALALKPQEHGHVPRVLEAMSEGVVFTTIEHSAAADSLAVLRPRLPLVEKAQALARAFHYMGRPYDFHFDFQTDSALVCTELVYKSYEPAPGLGGLRLKMEEIVGHTAIPANSFARQYDQEPDGQFELVLFLDGQERLGRAVEAGAGEFRKSWRRPKWHVIVQPKVAAR